MAEQIQEPIPNYAALEIYAAQRTKELSRLLNPFIEVTDRYGELICQITLILGKASPSSKEDAMARDLMADVFDFLYEARGLILKGKQEVAYPLARRAYESLSLMVACHLEPKLAKRWMAGKQINNAEVRREIAKHPMGETEQITREFYSFFSQVTHPNRHTVAHRWLGQDNDFTLGSIGQPSLAMLADYALKTLNLWYWFGAFISFTYISELDEFDNEMLGHYHHTAIHLHDRHNVLQEVELLVRGGEFEVFALVVLALGRDLTVFPDNRIARFFSKRRVGQHHVEPLAGVPSQCIALVDRAAVVSNTVQVEVHCRQPYDFINDIDTIERSLTQRLQFFAVLVLPFM